MAQAKVTEFFSAKKRGAGSHASKRRKIEVTENGTDVLSLKEINARPTRASTRSKTVVDSLPENIVHPPGPEAKSVKKTKTVRKVGKTKTPARNKSQKSIKEVFGSLQNDLKCSDSDSLSETSEVSSLNDEKIDEEITSAWDEHDGMPHTPTKRAEISSDSSDDTESQPKSRKRTRKGKSVQKDDIKTPEKVVVTQVPRRAKKRLQLRANVIASSSESETSENEECKESSGKLNTLSLTKTPVAISPLPDTPDNVRQHTKNVPDVPKSAAVKSAMAKVKQLQESSGTKSKAELKLKSDDVKAKLAKCGKLEDLKMQLTKMNETVSKLKKPVPKLQKFDQIELEVKPELEKPKKAPAYERFHSLATPAPPTLSLPYKYKLIAEMFRSMDTVVSMLHNRYEICTYSKLKAAVQEMTKRNFEERNIGQIKNVYSTAYNYRQEKGLPAFGHKVSGYQLTIEANLDGNEENSAVKAERRTFSANDLLERRNTFHSKLIGIVKKYHKEFLANLQRPLSIPDHKITRWHPGFRLDEVPDVEPDSLPQPPVVLKYQSAKDVLESQRGKLLPRVEKALESVAAKPEVLQETKVKVEPTQSNTTSSQFKGIPTSLLEKIRAKEAKKMEAAMMRNPVEDKKTVMLGRLPEMMRILRSHFIQEKKPALVKENVVQKLCDSYKSFISLADIEQHVDLMLEMTPEWLKMVEIKKGKYLKMDRNIDLQKLTEKINNVLKNRR